jgi:hypothetical protein
MTIHDLTTSTQIEALSSYMRSFGAILGALATLSACGPVGTASMHCGYQEGAPPGSLLGVAGVLAMSGTPEAEEHNRRLRECIAAQLAKKE